MRNIIDLDRWEEIMMTITRNKTRSILTAFGVFWGIFMLIVLIGGGNGMRVLIGRSFSSFATNSCFVSSHPTSEAYKGFRKGRYWSLNVKDVDILRSNIPEIAYIVPMLFSRRGDNNILCEDKFFTGGVKGVMKDYENIEHQSLVYGRFLNDIDVNEQRKVCVIGIRIYETLFAKGEDPTGKYIRVDGVYYQVIGVVETIDSDINIGGNAEETVILPFTTMQNTYQTGNSVHLIAMTGKPGVKIQTIESAAERVVKQNHMIAPNDAQAVLLINAEKLYKLYENLFIGIDLLIWIVGLGTLLAGVIGVSNIMMITVRERTGEIGVRRAIGARPYDIMGQVISESMVLTGLAGMLGISLAVYVLELMNVGVTSAKGYYASFEISFWTVVGATFILLLLGSLAGLAPAFRAMNIKPIDAIREE